MSLPSCGMTITCNAGSDAKLHVKQVTGVTTTRPHSDPHIIDFVTVCGLMETTAAEQVPYSAMLQHTFVLAMHCSTLTGVGVLHDSIVALTCRSCQ